MKDITTLEKRSQESHLFCPSFSKVTSRGKSSHFPSLLQLYVANICNLCDTKVVTESEMYDYPPGCLPPQSIPQLGGFREGKRFRFKASKLIKVSVTRNESDSKDQQTVI